MGFESRETAEKVLQALKKRFALYGLELHPQKTRLLYLGKPKPGSGTKPGSFDFLEFTHFWGKSVNGKWIIRRKTASKKFREKLIKMNEWCRKNRHMPVREQHEKLTMKLKGHYGLRVLWHHRKLAIIRIVSPEVPN